MDSELKRLYRLALAGVWKVIVTDLGEYYSVHFLYGDEDTKYYKRSRDYPKPIIIKCSTI